jgi:hypothetical protein
MNPDSDPDPAIFVIDLQDANKKTTKKSFFPMIKVKKKSKTVGIKVSLTIFA